MGPGNGKADVAAELRFESSPRDFDGSRVLMVPHQEISDTVGSLIHGAGKGHSTIAISESPPVLNGRQGTGFKDSERSQTLLS